jgi:hypothetical protein
MQSNEFTTAPANSSVAAKLVLPLRILLGVMCLAGLLGWSYGILVVVAYYGHRSLTSPWILVFLLPFIYLILTLYSCLKTLSFKTLTILGAVLNAPLLALFLYSLANIEDYLRLQVFLPVAYILGWTFLLIARWFAGYQLSARKRAITISVMAGILLLATVSVFPLTVDHESEAVNFLRAGSDGSPGEAQANFAEALRHATRIRRKSQRVQLIQQIALAQASRKLYDDSKSTQAYLNDAEEGDRDWLTSTLVRVQLKNGDYDLAHATARPLNSSGRFQIQYLALEAEASAREGRHEEARQILNTAIALANEQPNADTQTYSFMFIAEAQSKIGWHDGALESARRLGGRKSIALLGGIGVNEAEAGYKDSARQTMQIIYATVNEAIGNCLQRRAVEEKDQCLSELVDELGDDRFFHLARTAATRISSISKRDLAQRSIAVFEARYLNSDLEDLIKIKK